MTSDQPGAARLYALLAGGLLSLLGVLGFFYDSSFATGIQLASDDLAGLLLVNGWRNVIYLATGIVALALAGSRPRWIALALGAFYLAFGIWGLNETKFGIGSLLDAIPLGDRDNALHMVLGILGLLAFAAVGGLREPMKAMAKVASRPRKPKPVTKAKVASRPRKPKPVTKAKDPKRVRPKAEGAPRRAPSAGRRSSADA